MAFISRALDALRWMADVRTEDDTDAAAVEETRSSTVPDSFLTRTRQHRTRKDAQSELGTSRKRRVRDAPTGAHGVVDLTSPPKKAKRRKLATGASLADQFAAPSVAGQKAARSLRTGLGLRGVNSADAFEADSLRAPTMKCAIVRARKAPAGNAPPRALRDRLNIATSMTTSRPPASQKAFAAPNPVHTHATPVRAAKKTRRKPRRLEDARAELAAADSSSSRRPPMGAGGVSSSKRRVAGAPVHETPTSGRTRTLRAVGAGSEQTPKPKTAGKWWSSANLATPLGYVMSPFVGADSEDDSQYAERKRQRRGKVRPDWRSPRKFKSLFADQANSCHDMYEFFTHGLRLKTGTTSVQALFGEGSQYSAREFKARNIARAEARTENPNPEDIRTTIRHCGHVLRHERNHTVDAWQAAAASLARQAAIGTSSASSSGSSDFF